MEDHVNDSEQMSSEDRFKEIAVILAKGFLLLKLKASFLEISQSKEFSRFAEKRLDFSARKSIHEPTS